MRSTSPTCSLCPRAATLNYGWTMDGRVTDEARLRQHIVTRTTQSAVDTLTRTSDPDVIR